MYYEILIKEPVSIGPKVSPPSSSPLKFRLDGGACVYPLARGIADVLGLFTMILSRFVCTLVPSGTLPRGLEHWERQYRRTSFLYMHT